MKRNFVFPLILGLGLTCTPANLIQANKDCKKSYKQLGKQVGIGCFKLAAGTVLGVMAILLLKDTYNIETSSIIEKEGVIKFVSTACSKTGQAVSAACGSFCLFNSVAKEAKKKWSSVGKNTQNNIEETIPETNNREKKLIVRNNTLPKPEPLILPVFYLQKNAEPTNLVHQTINIIDNTLP